MSGNACVDRYAEAWAGHLARTGRFHHRSRRAITSGCHRSSASESIATYQLPGILVSGLDDVAERLDQHGVEVTWDDNFPGMRRSYAADAFGNRLEFLEPLS